MYFIYVFLTAIFIVIYVFLQSFLIKYNTQSNLFFIDNFVKTETEKCKNLYVACQKYSRSERLVVECSIQISKNNVNHQRVTIPISIKNLKPPKKMFLFVKEMFPGKNNNYQKNIYDFIMLHINNDMSKCNGDIIVGYDFLNKNHKLYVDDAKGNMECLEFKDNFIGRKIYEEVKMDEINLSSKMANLLFGVFLLRSNSHIIYKVVGSNTYHFVLKSPTLLCLDHLTQTLNFTDNKANLHELYTWFHGINHHKPYIYVVSCKANDTITMYIRPNHIVSRLDNSYLRTLRII